jgi:hypothetical protein
MLSFGGKVRREKDQCWFEDNIEIELRKIRRGNMNWTGLESREYGRGNSSRWPRGTLYPQNVALTSPTSGGRSVGIVRSRTQPTEFGFSMNWIDLAQGTDKWHALVNTGSMIFWEILERLLKDCVPWSWFILYLIFTFYNSEFHTPINIRIRFRKPRLRP